MPNSLEFSVEGFFVALFKADSRSAGKDVCHFDEESSAKTKAIVVQAKQGAHSLAGPGGYELEVMIEYRGPFGTSKAENNLTAAMLHDIVYDSTVSLPDRAAMATAAGLSELLIKDESSGTRSNSADLRKRTLMLPVQAKLA